MLLAVMSIPADAMFVFEVGCKCNRSYRVEWRDLQSLLRNSLS